jgi:hypothetical protein
MRWPLIMTVLMVVGCGRESRPRMQVAPAPQTQTQLDAQPATQESSMSNGAYSPTGERHPGEIVNDNKVDGRTYTKSAADVPKTIAWVKVDGTWQAVVKIEVTGTSDRLEITQYGVDGKMLQRTIQAPPPPPR